MPAQNSNFGPQYDDVDDQVCCPRRERRSNWRRRTSQHRGRRAPRSVLGIGAPARQSLFYGPGPGFGTHNLNARVRTEHDAYLRPPSITPRTICFWKRTKMISTGTTDMADAAINRLNSLDAPLWA